MNADAAVFLIVLAVILAGIAVVARRHRSKRQAGATARAEAEVLRVWQDGEGPHYVEYRFTPPEGVAVTNVALGGCLRAGLPELGDRIAIRYDPANPRNSFLADDSCGTG